MRSAMEVPRWAAIRRNRWSTCSGATMVVRCMTALCHDRHHRGIDCSPAPQPAASGDRWAWALARLWWVSTCPSCRPLDEAESRSNRSDYNSFADFSDPDGIAWVLQEVKRHARCPQGETRVRRGGFGQAGMERFRPRGAVPPRAPPPRLPDADLVPRRPTDPVRGRNLCAYPAGAPSGMGTKPSCCSIPS